MTYNSNVFNTFVLTYRMFYNFGLGLPQDPNQVDRNTRRQDGYSHEAFKWAVVQGQDDEEGHDQHEEDWENKRNLQEKRLAVFKD